MDTERDYRRMFNEQDDRGYSIVQYRLVQGQLQIERRLIGHQAAVHYDKGTVLTSEVCKGIGKAGFDCNHT